MRIEAQRPSSRRTDLAPGHSPQRRAQRGNFPGTHREETEIALRLGSDGMQETIPVTREILLNPSLDVQIVQNPPHDHKLRWLAGRLEPFLRARSLVVHCDVGLNWSGLRTVSPDLSVIENLPTPELDEPDPLSIKVAGDCRVKVVFEVVSSGKHARWKDEEKNPPFFAQRGVDECVLLYLPKQRRATDPPIRVFADPRATGYSTQRHSDAQGFFELRSIGVRIGVESTKDGGETIVVLNARTGERLPDVEEALQRTAQAEQRAAQAEEEKQQAEQRAAQAEQLNQEMAAEIERLRAQLGDAD
jgi:hypothetical protein